MMTRIPLSSSAQGSDLRIEPRKIKACCIALHLCGGCTCLGRDTCWVIAVSAVALSNHDHSSLRFMFVDCLRKMDWLSGSPKKARRVLQFGLGNMAGMARPLRFVQRTLSIPAPCSDPEYCHPAYQLIDVVTFGNLFILPPRKTPQVLRSSMALGWILLYLSAFGLLAMVSRATMCDQGSEDGWRNNLANTC